MKKVFVVTLVLGLFAGYAQALDKIEASALSTIESFAVYADKGQFSALENVFAEKVALDYTSAFGGEPSIVESRKLMIQWASLLPGFDVTRHDLSDIQVEVNGDNAKGHAKVSASHWIGEEFWSISGTYDFELVRKGFDWQITSLKLNAAEEKGTRDVLVEATKSSSQSPHPYLSN